MRAEIVSVGTELLLGTITDTHAPFMAKILADCGISCQRRTTVGDNFERIVSVFRETLDRAEILITIGGLGPTGDDLTRDGIAAAIGDELVAMPEYEAKLREFFSSRGLVYSESNSKQALRPASGRPIENPNGTAPGLYVQKGGKHIFALPGPKGEFNPMAKGEVREILSTLGEGSTIHSRTLRICGLGESHVESLLGDLMASDDPTIAPYAHTGEVHIRITSRAESKEAAERKIDPMEAKVREILGDAVYGRDEESLETALVRELRERAQTVATAESITGGGLAKRITDVPGVSGIFRGGMVVYSIESKVKLLGLDINRLREEGPVSEWTARELARSIRNELQADHGIALVGNAGPTAEPGGEPVGRVYIGYSGCDGEWCESSLFRGTREDVRRRAEQSALTLLRRSVMRGGEESNS